MRRWIVLVTVALAVALAVTHTLFGSRRYAGRYAGDLDDAAAVDPAAAGVRPCRPGFTQEPAKTALFKCCGTGPKGMRACFFRTKHETDPAKCEALGTTWNAKKGRCYKCKFHKKRWDDEQGKCVARA
jgi:hypothetical protein